MNARHFISMPDADALSEAKPNCLAEMTHPLVKYAMSGAGPISVHYPKQKCLRS
jgi:hypothetical protein